jgi:hypothetical protein
LIKFNTLTKLANRVFPAIEQDLSELASKGYTNAERSKEFSAIVETLICELYCALDCLRTTLYFSFRKTRGIQDSSTERMFRKAKENAYGPEFPSLYNDLLIAAADDWFSRLRLLRTELMHGGTGSCHRDNTSQKTMYIHEGLGDSGKAFIIEDIHAEINIFAKGVHGLVYSIFDDMYKSLESINSQHVCGFFKGRIYQRYAIPEPVPHSQMGKCMSFEWFEKELDYICPLKKACKAYGRGNPRS